MKVAILISGSPRFNKDFDTFVNGLQGVDQVDWFCHLWKYNPPPDKLGYENYTLVSDFWRNVDQAKAQEKILENLPSNHKLIKLEIYNNNLIEYPEVPGEQMHHINFKSIWKMHLGWKYVDILRQAHQEDYDLVIRARPDLHLPNPINLINIKNMLDQDTNTMLVPSGAQHGHGYNINDVMAIASPKNMEIYTDLVSHSIKYNLDGIIFHPETLLAYHLVKNKLKIMPFINVGIRSNMIKTLDNHFTVDFGNWLE